MEWVHGLTPYAGGFAAPGTTGGTAVGVCACMTAAAEHVFGTADLAGLGATVVGLGGVGELLARRAAENGATLTVTDRAAEFSAGGVRVNTVSPGPTRSDKVIGTMGAAAEQLGDATALSRMPSTAEIAQVILFLASDRSSYITGATLAADGGRTAI